MNTKEKVTVSWSGGKDCALAVNALLAEGRYEIVHLHSIVDRNTKRVGMHGIREELIDAQARSMQLPLVKLYLESAEDNTVYGALMRSFYSQCANEGIQSVVLGDIYLEDLRKYRESLLEGTGLRALFPLWGSDSSQLISSVVKNGFQVVICCCNQVVYDAGMLGAGIDENFIANLPNNIDPCGERGEFHSFVTNAPYFKGVIKLKKGEVVRKTYSVKSRQDDGGSKEESIDFWFQDFVPLIDL